jgi:hypothetical protein
LSISDVDIIQICNNIKNIKIIKMKNCNEIKNVGVEEINNIKKIVELKI